MHRPAASTQRHHPPRSDADACPAPPLSPPPRSAAPATTALFAALGGNTSLTSLALLDCPSLPPGSVAAFARSLRRNKTLRELHLCKTPLWDAGDEDAAGGGPPGGGETAAKAAASLLAAIGDGPERGSLCALDVLDCTGCFRVADTAEASLILGDGLRGGAASRLRELRLGSCELGDEGAPLCYFAPAEALLSALPVRSLSIARPLSPLTRRSLRRLPSPPEAKAIADGLRDPACRLESLDLSENGIGDSGGARSRSDGTTWRCTPQMLAAGAEGSCQVRARRHSPLTRPGRLRSTLLQALRSRVR